MVMVRICCRLTILGIVSGALLGATMHPATAHRGAATSEPVKIGVIYSEGVPGNDLPTIRRGAEAAAEYLTRQRDGILGAPVEIVACNDKVDPAQDIACANKFIDEGVVAVAGLDAVWGDNGLSTIASAGIPFVGIPISNAEFVSPNSYPIMGGSVAAFPALADYFIDRDVRKVAVIYADLAAGKLAADLLIGDRFKAAGIDDVTLLPEKNGAPDFTPVVVRANEGDPDVIFLLFAADDCVRILQAASEVAVQADFAVPSACAEAKSFDRLDDALASRVVFNSDTLFYRPKNPDAKIYRRALAKYAKGAPVDGFGATSFATVMTLETICEQPAVTACTSAGVLDALKNAAGIPVFMATELDKAHAAELAGVATNVYNADERIVKLEGRGFVDAAGNRWWNAFE